MPEVTISLLVEGGKASGGPPLGPALGPLGINVQDVVKSINEQTKDFAGVTVPVSVIVNKEKKQFRIEIGMPSVASLLKKEIGIEKGAKAEPGQRPAPVGDITMQQVIKIAKIKMQSTNATGLKSAVLNVLGTCSSIGLTCEGQDIKTIVKKVKKGEFDEIFK
ncbi:MAG: 50S ribosomal protein L11 [Candidatus Micrarchaeia archaeon]